MKLCVLTPTFLPKIGGTEIALDSLTRQWHKQCEWVGLVTQVPRHGEPYDDSQFPYPVRRYGRPWSTKGYFWGVQRVLTQWHREVGFDMLTAHQVYPSGFAAALWARKHGVPFTVTCRGGDVSQTSRFRENMITRKRLQWCLKAADGITSISDDLAREASELAGGRDVTIIHNGADTSLADPVNQPRNAPWYPLLSENPFLLYMKRMQSTKGHDTLLRAYAEVWRDTPELPLLVFAGEGPEQDNLVKLIGQLGLDQRIVFTGNALGDEKKWLLQHCHAFVHTSLREGFGIVILEAMMCGKAILAARSEGVVILVEPESNGLLVEPGNVPELAGALRRFITECDLNKMGAASLKKSEQFRWENSARLYCQAFEEARTQFSRRRASGR